MMRPEFSSQHGRILHGRAQQRADHLTFNPEFLLAAACASWPPSEERNDAIRRAAERVTDWPRFRRVVARHRIPGLAHDGLTRARVMMPAETASALSDDARALVLSTLAMTAEAVRLKRLFHEHDIPVAFVKGPTLARLAYGSIGIRHSKDIDVLVRPDSIEPAVSLMEQAGYRRVVPAPHVGDHKTAIWIRTFKHFIYLNDARGLVVELHWRLSDNPSIVSSFPPMPALREIPIADGVSLPTLAADDLFLYLCVHGASHCWFRLKWVADIAALIASMPLPRKDREQNVCSQRQ